MTRIKKKCGKEKNVEYRRKHLITSTNLSRKNTARAAAAAAKTECERVWHSMAMEITEEKKYVIKLENLPKIFSCTVCIEQSTDAVLNVLTLNFEE